MNTTSQRLVRRSEHLRGRLKSLKSSTRLTCHRNGALLTFAIAQYISPGRPPRGLEVSRIFPLTFSGLHHVALQFQLPTMHTTELHAPSSVDPSSRIGLSGF
ncbi:hypothetical protein GALMADRAFT_1139061 [Galerina marginata CBS 339.88]|uniref:Uncharacterized protein n=1 Tax=Galerina marginata (strain CBS 339.88) TaxID=685588 RepID=A0A067SG47_GALM3|nr:hypothetical protein GALMADRAFT_1139061 [Galerina marginata CBS 339.88]